MTVPDPTASFTPSDNFGPRIIPGQLPPPYTPRELDAFAAAHCEVTQLKTPREWLWWNFYHDILAAYPAWAQIISVETEVRHRFTDRATIAAIAGGEALGVYETDAHRCNIRADFYGEGYASATALECIRIFIQHEDGHMFDRRGGAAISRGGWKTVARPFSDSPEWHEALHKEYQRLCANPLLDCKLPSSIPEMRIGLLQHLHRGRIEDGKQRAYDSNDYPAEAFAMIFNQHAMLKALGHEAERMLPQMFPHLGHAYVRHFIPRATRVAEAYKPQNG